MKVIFKEPGKDARRIVVDGSLKTFQDLVGGHIEHIGLSERLGILCDEEGKLKGYDPNFRLAAINDWIVGNAIFVGEGGEDFTDIHEDDAETVMLFLGLQPDLMKEEE